MDRRKFLTLMGMAGVAAAIPWKFNMRRMMLESARAYAFAQTPILTKFRDSLPGLTLAGQNNLGQYLTVMTPNDPLNLFPGSDYYHVVASQFTQQVHTELPSTTFWGYAQDGGPGDINKRYLGGVIVATANRPVRLTVRNNLPAAHILPVDPTIMNANGIPGYATGVNRLSTHLHGGFPPWISDGTPYQDFSNPANAPGPGTGYGPSTGFPPDMVAITPPGSYSYYWTNQQLPKFMWYHDHAMGITRLNAYAGVATGYVVTDSFEQSLTNAGILPTRTVYMVLQDKGFNSDGSLWYPSVYEIDPSAPPPAPNSGRWTWGGSPPAGGLPPTPVSAVPEAFFDSIIINGCVYPYLEVEPRHYRFRILNGSQARVYNLQLYYAQSNDLTNPASGEVDLTKPGPKFVQIGTEGGFLPTPVIVDSGTQIAFDTNPASPTFGNATAYSLLLAPAERADLVIDFTNVPVGSKLILYSDAPAPFPMGDPRNDYYTGDPDYSTPSGNPDNLFGGAPTTAAGKGPNTRTLMQFRVKARIGAADSPSLNTLQTMAVKNLKNAIFPPITPLPQNGVPVRRLTLNETFDADYGRLIQMLGTDVTQGPDAFGVPIFYSPYVAGRGEVVTKNTKEIWEIINLTGDTHPIHFHLVNVQVLNRQVFDDVAYINGGLTKAPGTAIAPNYIGAPRPPDKNEMGWKETVRMNPHEVTRVIMKFDLPTVPFSVPLSTRLADPTMPPGPNNPQLNGYEYVWHCHILEHEEHDMMHALVVTP